MLGWVDGCIPGTKVIPYLKRYHKTPGTDSRASCEEAGRFNPSYNMADCEASGSSSWKKCLDSGADMQFNGVKPSEAWKEKLCSNVYIQKLLSSPISPEPLHFRVLPLTVEAFHTSMAVEPEKLKRNPRKFSALPSDSVPDSELSELEKVKRNLRKATNSMVEASKFSSAGLILQRYQTLQLTSPKVRSLNKGLMEALRRRNASESLLDER
ncbi:hypothetical protein PR202_ga09882 [Eleusine coracana subsp. coracana]|uniref:Uncharacterized protein n=1 Tax=Eleusine coracana subsp. coracana TaxID=191504 RepID=A0AAV5C5B5_ELECO|nr:hypothetical protein PR202_ga09882 [Eleusine coracana subsp. coracana]